MLYDLYESIRNRLKDKVPALKQVALWNNQTSKENFGKENIQTYPAAYVEWGTVSYEQTANGEQVGTMDLSIHLLAKSLKNDDKAPYLLAQAVFKALQGYNEAFYEPLTRKSEAPDQNHDEMFVYVITFACQFTDGSAHVDTHTIDAPVKLALDLDLIIDQPTVSNVRTGRFIKIEDE